MVHGSHLPRRGKRPKATAQQNVGELYSGLYARKYGVPRARSGQKERDQEHRTPAANSQRCIAPAQTIRILIIECKGACLKSEIITPEY